MWIHPLNTSLPRSYLQKCQTKVVLSVFRLLSNFSFFFFYFQERCLSKARLFVLQTNFQLLFKNEKERRGTVGNSLAPATSYFLKEGNLLLTFRPTQTKDHFSQCIGNPCLMRDLINNAKLTASTYYTR